MKMKAIVFFALIAAFLVSSIPFVAAQTSPANSVTVSPTSLSFFGNEKGAQLNRTLTFVGITNQTVNVTLVPTDLYDNNTGRTLPANDVSFSVNNVEIAPPTFNITSNTTIVTVSLNTSQTIGGNYQGTIVMTYAIYNSTTNSLQIASTNVGLSVVIQLGISLVYSPEIWAIVGIIIAEFIAFLFPDQWGLKTIIVAFVGAAVIITWIFILFYFGFTPTSGILTAIATIVIIPFGTWVIGYFNDKRTTGNDKIKSSRVIENDGNKSDIDLIRGVLGELAMHAASFKPTVSEKKPFPIVEDKSRMPLDKRAIIFYIENDKLSKKVWDDSCKQGAMSDIPVLSLQRYYGFVDIYNRYYSCALQLTKDNEEISKSDAAFLTSFEAFRLQYFEVETVLFTHLSYLLGLIIKTNLTPLPMEFPRVNRVFLKKMIDYELLDPKKYPGNFEMSPELPESWKYKREFLEKYSPTRRRLQEEQERVHGEGVKKTDQDYRDEVVKEYGNRFSESALSEKYIRLHGLSEKFEQWRKNSENTKAIEEQVKKEVPTAKKTGYALRNEFIKSSCQEDFVKWEADEYSLWIAKVKAKDKIGAWRMTETGLENISDVIYRNDSIPKFYRKVGEDFNNQFEKLETKMKSLKPLTAEFLEKEKQTAAVMDDQTIKFLSDSIDGLKKLLNPPVATQPPAGGAATQDTTTAKPDQDKK